jgi:ATP-binding cassette subfamily G (WHITE) protein 2
VPCCSWSDAVPYFDSYGYSCPLYKNPSDFFLMLASAEDTITQLADAQTARWAADKGDVEAPALPPTRRAFSTSSHGDSVASTAALRAELQAELTDASDQLSRVQTAPPSAAGSVLKAGLGAVGEEGALALQQEGGSGPAVPVWYQIWVLAVRFLRSWLRHPLLLASEAGQFVFIAVFLGRRLPGWLAAPSCSPALALLPESAQSACTAAQLYRPPCCYGPAYPPIQATAPHTQLLA